MTPGPKFSTTTSHFETSRCASACASGFLRFSVTLPLPLAVTNALMVSVPLAISVIEPLAPVVTGLATVIPPPMLFCFRFKFDINDYLPRLAPDAQVKSLEDIIKSGKYHPSIEKRLLDRQAEAPLDQNPRCAEVARNTQRSARSENCGRFNHGLRRSAHDYADRRLARGAGSRGPDQRLGYPWPTVRS